MESWSVDLVQTVDEITSAVSWSPKVREISRSLYWKPNPLHEDPNRRSFAPRKSIVLFHHHIHAMLTSSHSSSPIIIITNASSIILTR